MSRLEDLMDIGVCVIRMPSPHLLLTFLPVLRISAIG